MHGSALAEFLFPQAAALWLRERHDIAPSTRKHYQDYIGWLGRFFRLLRLREITLGHIITYQISRREAIRGSRRHQAGRRGVEGQGERPESDGASRINHELSCLGQILQQAGLWEALRRFYRPLPLPRHGPGIALTPDEETHFFQVARSRPRWRVAFCCELLSRNTTAGPGEILHLRLMDVELDTAAGSFIHIEEGLKNEFRRRPVPLNADALKVVRWLLGRAHALGARDPEHYLLPHRARRRRQGADPARPMGSWKRAHESICRVAGKKFPRLARLRPYDFRHTAATDMLEDPAIAYATIEHMMGHRLSSNTKRKYDHLRNTALQVAADSLNRDHAGSLEEPERKRPQSAPGAAFDFFTLARQGG